LPELHVELTRLAGDQEILRFLTSKQIEKKETDCWWLGGWLRGV
jgi:hypothetical protein